MTDETKDSIAVWAKEVTPKIIFMVILVVVTSVVTTKSNQKDIQQLQDRGSIQAQKNTERIIALESIVTAQTDILKEMRSEQKEMRTDIKVLLGR